MELVSLYYFTELAKTLNITKTAERLFVTQQTLSNHIARLEEYYDIPLFYRSPSLSLTPAGELVLAFANTVNRAEGNLKDTLSDMKQEDSGVLRFGGSAVRINNLLPHILPAFSERYPKVDVQFYTQGSVKGLSAVLDGTQDFAMTIAYEKNSNLIAHHLASDLIYLCVSDGLLRKYYGEETDALKRKSERGALIADFAKLPFCMADNLLGDRVNKCFQEARFTPWAHITSDKTALSVSVCYEGLAASFISHIYLLEHQDKVPPDVSVFPLLYQGKPLVQNLYLIRRKDRYLPQYSKFFLDLVFRHYSKVGYVHSSLPE